MQKYVKLHNFLKMKKNEIVTNYDIRSDYKQVLTLRDYDETLFKQFVLMTFKNLVTGFKIDKLEDTMNLEEDHLLEYR